MKFQELVDSLQEKMRRWCGEDHFSRSFGDINPIPKMKHRLIMVTIIYVEIPYASPTSYIQRPCNRNRFIGGTEFIF
jgi:hypothetical protein